MAEGVAVVDIGTNSVRLLVVRPGPAGAAETVERRNRITRLGQGVDGAGRLHPAAVARTLAVVEEYAERWRAAGVAPEDVRITATSAARDASDASGFAREVHRVTGIWPEVLSGAEEATLAFAGATAGLPELAGPVVVLDIGGGSTELISGDGAVERSCSLQLGAVRLTERFLAHDPPMAAEVARATAEVDHQLADAAGVVAGGGRTLIGTAGTVTTVAAVHLGLEADVPGTVHGARLTAGDVNGVAARLLEADVASRRLVTGIARGREDVIAAGALILARVCRRYAFEEVIISEADILDGLAAGMIRRAGARWTDGRPKPNRPPRPS